jgi:hypothetical protein
MSARRAGTVAVASVVAAALLLVVLAAWASSIGPGGVLRGDGPPSAGTPTVSESVSAPAGDDGAPVTSGTERHGTPSWVRVAAFIVNAAVAVGVAYLLLRYVVVPLARGLRLRRVRRSARRARGEEDVDFCVVEPPDAVAREILAGADGQRRALADDGTPRNAIVECWHRFESRGAAAGLERRPWETSAEYTLRVLDLVEAYQPAVLRLAELYREARFSEHEVTEDHRAKALEALDAIHRTIGVRA